MSRCFPFPPPGYEKKASKPPELVPELAPPPQDLKAHKEKHKHKDKDKKKKRKREDKDESSSHKEKHHKSKNHKTREDATPNEVHMENGRMPEAVPPASKLKDKAKAAPSEEARISQQKVSEPGKGDKVGVQASSSTVKVGETRVSSSVKVDTGKKAGVQETKTSGSSSRIVLPAGRPAGVQETRTSGSSSKVILQETKPSGSSSRIVVHTGKQVQETRTLGSGAKPQEARPSTGKPVGLQHTAKNVGLQHTVGKPVGSSGNEARTGSTTGKQAVVVPGNEARTGKQSGVGNEARTGTSTSGKVGIQEARTSLQKPDKEKSSTSKQLSTEINGKLPPLILAKPLDTGQATKVKEEPKEIAPKVKYEVMKLPEVKAELNEEESLDWLCPRSKPENRSDDPRTDISDRVGQSESEVVWADAIYVPSLEMHALPYVVPY